MASKEKLYGRYLKISEDLNKWNIRMKKARSEKTRKKYYSKIATVEKQMRSIVNSRLRSLRKAGLDIDTDIIDAYILRQGAKRKYLGKVSSENIFTQAKVEANFLKNAMSTPSGALEGLQKIRKDFEGSGYTFKSDDEFIEFYKWRQENSVQEFFNIFPPSPPEMRGNVSSMIVDLYNKDEKTKEMVKDYFSEFQRFLDTQNEDWTEGINMTMLIDRIKKLYESEVKRRRV